MSKCPQIGVVKGHSPSDTKAMRMRLTLMCGFVAREYHQPAVASSFEIYDTTVDIRLVIKGCHNGLSMSEGRLTFTMGQPNSRVHIEIILH
jgi:hypothetical protein